MSVDEERRHIPPGAASNIDSIRPFFISRSRVASLPGADYTDKIRTATSSVHVYIKYQESRGTGLILPSAFPVVPSPLQPSSLLGQSTPTTSRCNPFCFRFSLTTSIQAFGIR